MKSFTDPGNRLRILHTDDNRGIVCFNEERDYRLVYILTDIYGNRSDYAFTVRGQRQSIPQRPSVPNKGKVLHWNQVNHYQLPGMHLTVRPQLLADDVMLQPSVTESREGLSRAYSFCPTSCPLFNWAQLSLRVSRPIAEPQRLCILCNGQNIGGTYRDGWVTAPIRELGAVYEVGIAPHIVNHIE